jgi:hypothetical protein
MALAPDHEGNNALERTTDEDEKAPDCCCDRVSLPHRFRQQAALVTKKHQTAAATV